MGGHRHLLGGSDLSSYVCSKLPVLGAQAAPLQDEVGLGAAETVGSNLVPEKPPGEFGKHA